MEQTFHCSFEVCDLHEGDMEVVVQSKDSEIKASYVINCAGLYADKVAAMGQHKADIQIVPFRGEYFVLSSRSRIVL